MTDLQVQNTAFKNECIRVLNAIFSEVSEMMCCEPEGPAQSYGIIGGKPFCKALGTTITRLATMSSNATDSEREGLRLQTRTDFLDLIDVVKHYGLMAIYEAGDHV